MSSAPNQFPQSSKPASSSQAETQPDPAPESSSPAETMTDQTSHSTLVTPPTRMTSPEDAVPKPDALKAAGSDLTSDEAVPIQATEPQQNPAQSTVAPATSESSSSIDATLSVSSRHQPIPPASEPMQYRAIGLVRGKYTPSEEQFTRGFILTDDGVLIDAVLLGRVMSLVKKHINLEESHLWVVYPRTREKDLELHMQIVGVWEPEKLNRSALDEADGDSEDADLDSEDLDDSEDIDEIDEETELTEDQVAQDEDSEESADLETSQGSDTEAPVAETQPRDTATASESTATSDDLDDRYFSVRGEVVYQSEEEQRLLVKIRRAPKPGSTQAKAFKIALKGILDGKAIGYFWDIHVQRENNELVITEANQIGMVPPQKRREGGYSGGPRRGGRPGGPPRRSGPGGQGGPPRKRWQNNRDGGQGAPGGRPIRSERPAPPSTPRQPISKPVKRPKTEE